MQHLRTPPRLLVVDLDGTLLGPDSQIGSADSDALQRAADAGLALLIATGRGRHSASRVLETLPVPAYAALHNGALVLDPSGAELWRRTMPAPAVAAAVALMRAGGLHPMLYGGGVAGAGGADARLVLERAARHSPYTQSYLSSKGLILELTDDVLAARSRGVLGVVSFGGRATVAAAADALASLRGQLASWWGITSDPAAGLLEAVAPGATKGGALLRLVARLGLTPEQVIAIGDNANDLEMLRCAGTAVAMANATAEVRAAAHFVTASNAAAGVARALDRLLPTST